MSMRRLRRRRGAIAILTVLLFLAMLAILAVVVDVARMQFMRNEMQTAADAAALAGAVQLVRTPKTDYLTQAKTFGQANPLLDSTVAIPDSAVQVGNWDPNTRTFTASGDAFTSNAVQVTVHHPASYLVAKILGQPVKQIAARSVAWAGPSVGKTDCMKPWALWYGLLMQKINQAENQPLADPNRPMTPYDLSVLQGMTPDQLTFTLFLGNTAQGTNLNSGNFYAVDLPPVQYANGTAGTPLTGASNYQNELAGVDNNGNPICYSVGVGDILQTEPGAMLGPTKQGVVPYICATMSGTTCLDASGNNPIIKSAFWTQATNKGSGKFYVNVAMIGSFVLQQWDSQHASITGVFQPTLDGGPLGDTTTTLVRVVLVK